METGSLKVAFTIFGELASSKNSRMPAMVGKPGAKRMLWIKSPKALAYESQALIQIPAAARVQFSVPVRVTLKIFYASERPDLDEALLLDVLQDRYHGAGERRRLIQKGVYCNDRLVRAKLVVWGLDRSNPRAEIEVEPLTAQQAGLDFQPTNPF